MPVEISARYAVYLLNENHFNYNRHSANGEE